MELLVGTNNVGKVREYRSLLADLPITFLTLADIGLDMDVDETGTTFAENATIKALAFAKASGLWTVADDSGLCVDALDGGPGVYSARFGGPGLDDRGRRLKLLEIMVDVPDGQRTAYFQCVIALARPVEADIVTVSGRCMGHIRRAESGTDGFGYDAIFQPDGFDVTFAELTREEKGNISHRGAAVRALVPVLRQLLEN